MVSFSFRLFVKFNYISMAVTTNERQLKRITMFLLRVPYIQSSKSDMGLYFGPGGVDYPLQGRERAAVERFAVYAGTLR
jgi:hypothetical protein